MKPVLLKDWFLLNLKIGALSFGGGGRILLYQEAVVDKRKWLSEKEFEEILTIAQLVPGPNLVNIALYLGFRLSGTWSSLIGLLGLSVPGVFVILLINAALDLTNPHISWLFKGFSIASATLFLVFLLRYGRGLFVSDSPAARSKIKIVLRCLVAICVGVASLNHVPLVEILLVSIGLSALSEWTL